MTSAQSNARSETLTLHRCIHCGTEWAPRRNEKQAPEFCCSGCEAAYHLIESAGLEDFYRYRSMESTWEASPVSARESAREMDSPEFLAKHAKALQGGSGYRILLDVAGVHCRACVWLIEQLPRMVPGVIEARLNLQRRQLTLTWDLSVVKLSSAACCAGQWGM